MEKVKQIIDKIGQATKVAAKAAWGFWQECREARKVAEQYAAENRLREQFRVFQEDMQSDYDAFADAFGSCVRGNYQKMGLVCPGQIEDVLCKENPKTGSIVPHIDGNYQNIIFRYEADRRISEVYLGGMKKMEFPKVSSEDIAKVLNSELRVYANRRGYGFLFPVEVDNIWDNRIRVQISGVYKLPQFCPYSQMPYEWGGEVW